MRIFIGKQSNTHTGGARSAVGDFGGTGLILCTKRISGDIDSNIAYFRQKCQAMPFINTSGLEKDCRYPVAILEELIENEEEVVEMRGVQMEPREQETRLDAREEALIENRVHPAGEEGARRLTERKERREQHDSKTGLWTTTAATEVPEAAQAGALNRNCRRSVSSSDSEEEQQPLAKRQR
jgi:hypothetical protein